jgi:hypothetical protein
LRPWWETTPMVIGARSTSSTQPQRRRATPA